MAEPAPDPLTVAIGNAYRRKAAAAYTSPSTATAAEGIVPAKATQSTSIPGLPAPYVQREPETREGQGGQKELMSWDPQTAKDSYNGAAKVPNVEQTKLEAVKAYTPDPYLPESMKEIEDATDPSKMGLVLEGVEVLGNWLAPFDFARRYSWQGVEEVARALPDPSPDLRYKGVSLDSATRVASDVMKAKDAGEVFDIAKQQIGDQAAGLAGKVMAGYIKGTDTSTAETAVRAALDDDTLLEEVGQNLYRAAATGKLAEQGRAHRGTGGVLQGVWGDTVNPIGRDIVEAALPKELAMQLADRAWAESNKAEAVKWHLLTTEVGREGVGLAMEVVADPMWLLGPAKGAQTVTKGEKAYTIARPVVAAAQAAADLTKSTTGVTTQALLDVLLQTPNEAKARLLLQQAINLGEDTANLRRTQAQRMLSEATDAPRAIAAVRNELQTQQAEVQALIAGYGQAPGSANKLKVAQAKLVELSNEVAKLGAKPKDAQQFLKRTAQMRIAEAASWDRKVADLRKVMNTEKGLITEQGRLALSVPGDTETKYLLRKGFLGDAAQKLTPEPLIRLAGDATDLFKPYTPEGIAGKMRAATAAGQDPLKALTRGESLAHETYNAVGRGLLIPAIAWDKLATIVGTRWLQPAIAYTEATRDMAAYGRSGFLHYKVPFWGAEVIRLKKVSPEVWNKYQTAVGHYLTDLGHLEGKLVNHTGRLVREAERVWKARRNQAAELERVAEGRLQMAQRSGDAAAIAAAEADLNRAVLWGSKSYTPQMVFDEAFDHVERGSGYLAEHPELQGFADGVRQLRDDIATATGKSREEVAQALQAMERLGQGDVLKYDALLGRLRATRDEMNAAVVPTPSRMKALRTQKVVLEDEARKVVPRFEPPAEGPASPTWARDLEAWEMLLWKHFRTQTQHLTDDERMLVAFSALRDMPDILPKQSAHYDAMAKAYPSLLGRRLGELPPDMQYLVADVKGLIASYEQLYEAHGRSFMADLSRRAKDWGVVGYVPHMVTDATKLKLSKAAEAMEYGGSSAAKLADVDAIDVRLSTSMDAAKRREIKGTVAEINALQADPSLAMTFDPQMLIARYLQSNRAMTAQDFLLTLMEGGVIRAVRREVGSDGKVIPSFAVAEREGLVPLFGRKSGQRDMDLIVQGSREEWAAAGVTPQELQRMRDDLKAADPFARWITETPELKAAKGVEEALLAIRQADWDAITRSLPGAPAQLFDPIEEFKRTIVTPGKSMKDAWDEVAGIMKDRAARAGVAMPLEGKDLATYYAQGAEVWKLYVPHAVAINMAEVLDAYKPGKTGNVIKSVIDKTNSFWKTRLTVMRMAFSTRNNLSNNLSNILDLGPSAALSPSTQGLAAQLTYAAHHRERWGTLENALARLSEGMREGESLNDYAARKIDLAAFKAPAAFGRSLEDLIRYGVDLGDGTVRPIDEALEMLSAKGVVSKGLGYADINRLEEDLASMMVHGGLEGSWDKVSRRLSKAEDVVVATLGALVSGGIPIALPKDLGGQLARVTETQSRLVNFIGNMKLTGNVDEAAAHVQKFLFNYDDLTGFQKVWLRTLIPFFTWTQKNIELQADMAQRAPYFYSTFNRLLIEGLPRLVQADDADYLGQGFAPESDLWEDKLRLRQRHTLHQVRIPIPARFAGGAKGQSLEGLGLPQEAAAEQLGMIGETLDAYHWMSSMAMHTEEKPYLRFLSQSAFAAKMAFEWASQQHVYYDRPLKDLTNGALIAQTVAGLRRFPLVGDEMADALEHATGLAITQDYNTRAGHYAPDIVVNPLPNWLFANHPWSAAIRDASAGTDIYHLSLANNAAQAKALGGTQATEVSPWLRYLDAITGIRVAQQDDAMRRKVVANEQGEVLDSILKARGHAHELERTAIEER